MNWQTLRELCRGDGPDVAAAKTLEMLSVNTFPTPVIDIAGDLGVHVRIESGPGMEGGLQWSNPPTLFINSLNSSIRRRFTCAHEIGHLIMHSMETNYVDETSRSEYESRVVERQANRFAAHLLMPLWKLESVVLHYGKNVEASMNFFGVSANALNWQLDLLK